MQRGLNMNLLRVILKVILYVFVIYLVIQCLMMIVAGLIFKSFAAGLSALSKGAIAATAGTAKVLANTGSDITNNVTNLT